MRGEITISPEQYHAGLDLLWEGISKDNKSKSRSVFRICRDELISQRLEITELKEMLDKTLGGVEFYGNDSKWRGRILDESDYMHIDPIDRALNYFNEGEHCGGKRAREILNDEQIKKYRESGE